MLQFITMEMQLSSYSILREILVVRTKAGLNVNEHAIMSAHELSLLSLYWQIDTTYVCFSKIWNLVKLFTVYDKYYLISIYIYM